MKKTEIRLQNFDKITGLPIADNFTTIAVDSFQDWLDSYGRPSTVATLEGSCGKRDTMYRICGRDSYGAIWCDDELHICSDCGRSFDKTCDHRPDDFPRVICTDCYDQSVEDAE